MIRKLFPFIAAILFVVPSVAYATPTQWDFSGGNLLQPLQSAWAALIKGDRFQATGTIASIFPNASTTVLSATTLCLTGDLPCRTTWPTGGSSFSYPFPSNATTTVLTFSNGLTGNVTGNATGNAGTATALQNARNINGVSFNGTANITVFAASSTLLGDNNTFSGSTRLGATTFTGITGTTQCLHVDTSGAVTGTGTDCGSSGGSVTAVTATYPILSSGGTAPVISTAFGTTTNWGMGFNGFVVTGATGIPFTAASSTLSLPNTALQNSTITVNSSAISLGGSATITAASSTLLANNNTFGGTNTFTNSPVFTALTGGLVSSNATLDTLYNTATSSVTCSTGVSCTGFVSAAAGGSTITNTGVTSNVAGAGISVSGATGAVTITNTIGYPFAVATNATTTLTQFNGGLTAYGTSTIGNGTASGGLTVNGNASTTGSLLVGSLSSGSRYFVSSSNRTLVDSTSNLETWGTLFDTASYAGGSGFLSVGASGGVPRTLTGTANQIGVTNGTGNGNPVFSLSSTLVVPGTFDAYASSTIGAGGQITGLTISGGSTTTLDAYFAGNVIVGNPGSLNIGGNLGKFEVLGTTGAAGSVSAGRWSNDTGGPNLSLYKSRGTTVGSLGLVQSGDSAGQLLFVVDDGADTTNLVASINASVDGVAASNDTPGRLTFNTTPAGAFLTTERMRITSAGNVGIASTTPFSRLSIGTGTASSSITVAEYKYGGTNVATSTAANIDCNASTQVAWPIGSAASTLTLVNMTPGKMCIVVIQNPNNAAGAITWAVSGGILKWAGGTIPSQTLTANAMDVWSFLSTQGSSTMQVNGAMTAGF